MKNKLQIMKNRPSVTDEEIRSYMNFDSVVNQYKAGKKNKQNWIRNTSVVLSILGISFLTYLYWPETIVPTVMNVPSLNTPIAPDSTLSSTESEPVTAYSDHTNQESVINTDESVSEKPVASKQEKAQFTKEETTVSTFLYAEAEPAGGYPNLYEYFSKELRYPAEALEDSIQGIVSVSFLIDQEGKPIQIKIVNSLGPAFDKEAQRLIENMPAWKPATLNGKAVAAKISLPFTFQIVNTNPEKK